MTDMVKGKVAFVTGAARGQGRAHALKLASEGADIIAVDICERVGTIPYPMATEGDLAQTVAAIEALGRKVVAAKVDVRDLDGMTVIVAEGVKTLGRLDIVCANAGIFSVASALDMTADEWRDMIDINLTGVWNTVKASLPHLVAGGSGGSIILTSSANGVTGAPMYVHYVAAKHGVVGLVKGLAIELAKDRIRVNGLLPAGVATDMVRDFVDVMGMDARYVEPDPSQAGAENPLKGILFDPADMSDPLLFLASDAARYVTGLMLHVDGIGLLHAESSGGNN
ncbi:MAG TPA: mycofactocin-coupled SDR family oxidoreductase [Sphingobium sp.]|nr:mycofactocin-coupled SDR family oxidoreductase [Sphingobium sp.]